MTTEQQAREQARELLARECEVMGGEETARILRVGRSDFVTCCAIQAIGKLMTQAAEDKRIADAMKWRPMDTCPINETVLLWNQDLEEISFGHKPEDATDENTVVILMTAAWADAWMPLPPEPESEPSDSDAPYLRPLPADAVGGGE